MAGMMPKRTFIQTNPTILQTLLKTTHSCYGWKIRPRSLSLLIYLDPPVANHSGNFQRLVVSLRSPPKKRANPQTSRATSWGRRYDWTPKNTGLNLRFGIWMSREDGPNKNTEPSSQWSEFPGSRKSTVGSSVAFFIRQPDYTPPKTKMEPENEPWKRRFLLKTTIFRFHHSFQGG